MRLRASALHLRRTVDGQPGLHSAPRRALALAAALAIAGAVCVGLAARANPEPAERRATPNPALVTAVWSPRRVPEIFRTAASAAALRRTLPAITSGSSSCASVDGDGQPVARVDDDQPLAGASTQKLLVAAAALAVMGPGDRFATRAVSDAPLQHGVLAGDLTVVGGGDPMLTTSDTPRTVAAPVTHLGGLADAIVAAGVHRIDGALVADDTRYDRDRAVPGWTAADNPAGNIGALGALVVDGGHGSDGLASSDPALDTVQALATMLAARGVEIANGATDPGVAAPTSAREIAHVSSAPLADLVGEMLTDSNNETAELLTREIGFRRTHAGTTVAGTIAIPRVLARLGVKVAGVDLHDGSGLAHEDRITCRALMGALALAARPHFHAIDAGLAVAGRTGTLTTRFAGTALAGRLRAKTGHIDGVVGLAGVIAPGARFAFAANGDFSTDTGASFQDQVATAILTFLDAPGPPGLVPAPERR